MNTPLRRVGVAMLTMIVLLLANATYIQVVKADDYRTDERNQRMLLEEYSRARGNIVSMYRGKLLATGRKTDDRLEYLRQYNDGAINAPVTGYYSWRYGSGGLERAANEFLSGSDERLFVRRLSDMITGRDPSGGHVRVTINPAAQRAAYLAMKARGYTGSVVALNPKTGEILAMVSTPSYDPNRLATHVGARQEKAWKELAADKGRPMVNRAIRETYPPGSTFKLVTTAAALENGMTPDSKVTSAARIKLPGTQTFLANFAGSTCPGSRLKDALAYSCNTAFAEIAGKLGKDKLTETAENFGIGDSDLEIPMRVVESNVGGLGSLPELYQSGIGQRDVRLTPLQDAMLAATVANGGMAMKPFLIKALLAPNLSTVDETDPEELTGDAALSPRNAELLRDMMIASEKNTSGGGKRSDLTIASKTGTAEHGANPKEIPPHAWYTAFAPAEDPQVAVAVIVESGGDRGLAATGGTVAAEIGRITIDAVLREGS